MTDNRRIKGDSFIEEYNSLFQKLLTFLKILY